MKTSMMIGACIESLSELTNHSLIRSGPIQEVIDLLTIAKKQASEETKVLISVRKGLVSGVHSNKDIKIVVVDWDSDDWDENGAVGDVIPNSASVSGPNEPDTISDDLGQSLYGKSEDQEGQYVAKRLKELNF